MESVRKTQNVNAAMLNSAIPNGKSQAEQYYNLLQKFRVAKKKTDALNSKYNEGLKIYARIHSQNIKTLDYLETIYNSSHFPESEKLSVSDISDGNDSSEEDGKQHNTNGVNGSHKSSLSQPRRSRLEVLAELAEDAELYLFEAAHKEDVLSAKVWARSQSKTI